VAMINLLTTRLQEFILTMRYINFQGKSMWTNQQKYDSSLTPFPKKCVRSVTRSTSKLGPMTAGIFWTIYTLGFSLALWLAFQ